MEAQQLTTALQETLTVFDGEGEPLTTTEVAESLDLGRRSTYERLERLVDSGHLETKKVGASARVWWLPTVTSLDTREEITGTNEPSDRRHFRDQTERLEQGRQGIEHELDQVFDRISDGFYILDDQMRFRYLNEHAREVLDLDESAIGQYFLDVVTVTEAFEKALFDAFNSQESVIMEDYYEPVDKWFANAIYPSASGLSVYFRDVTERKERELQLERYADIIDAVGEPVYELDTEGRFTFVNEPFVEQSGYSEAELLGEHVSVGIDEDAIDRGEAEILTLLQENSDGTATLEYDVVTKDGEQIPVENRISLVTDEEGMVRGSAGVVRDVTERKARERELERQREQIAALNNLNETVREIAETVIEEPTRAEIERAACEGLADSDSYTFAWIAEVDAETEQILPRIEAGVDGYHDDIDLSADPEVPVGRGPAGRAARRSEIQVSTNVFEDSTFEPWREYAETYDYSSFAAIPITHENTLYGLLGLYSEREGAFEESERTVVGQLGEIVGHAIAAADRKQALLSDEVVELQFRTRDVFDAFGLDVPATGSIAIEHTVPVGDGEFLLYGTVTEAAIETLETVVSSYEKWHTVRFWENDDEAAFELRVSGTPVLSKVASLGGSIEHAAIEDGDFFATIHLAPSTDLRPLMETFEEHYPSSELVKRRQRTRPQQSTELNQSDIESQLTSRQRTVLETAVYAGYFAWPREADGEDVAESLGIAPSTFSQHLRKAQQNVFSLLFSTEP